MKKHRPIICHHLNGLHMGGSEKMVQIMMKDFVKDETFNHVLAFQSQQDRSREKYFSEIMGENKLIPYASYPEFIAIVRRLQPFIIHRYSAGIPEFPFIQQVKDHTRHFVSTSVFGNQDDSIEISKVIFVSKHVQHMSGCFGDKYHVVRNAIEKPYSSENLREQFALQGKFVFGHIGRPDNNTFDNLNLRAYKEIENENTMFLWLPDHHNAREAAEELGIKNIIFLPRTTDDIELSKFYNTVDVLAHSRKDGECNSASMFEANVHGCPIISHYGNPFNGHVETIGDAGFVVMPNDVKEYGRIMKGFVDGEIDLQTLSHNAWHRWNDLGRSEDRSKEQLNIYKGLL